MNKINEKDIPEEYQNRLKTITNDQWFNFRIDLINSLKERKKIYTLSEKELKLRESLIFAC